MKPSVNLVNNIASVLFPVLSRWQEVRGDTEHMETSVLPAHFFCPKKIVHRRKNTLITNYDGLLTDFVQHIHGTWQPNPRLPHGSGLGLAWARADRRRRLCPCHITAALSPGQHRALAHVHSLYACKRPRADSQTPPSGRGSDSCPLRNACPLQSGPAAPGGHEAAARWEPGQDPSPFPDEPQATAFNGLPLAPEPKSGTEATTWSWLFPGQEMDLF